MPFSMMLKAEPANIKRVSIIIVVRLYLVSRGAHLTGPRFEFAAFYGLAHGAIGSSPSQVVLAGITSAAISPRNHRPNARRKGTRLIHSRVPLHQLV